MNFEKYFPFPWKSDGLCYIWSANNETPLMAIDDDIDSIDDIADIINDEAISQYYKVEYDKESQTILSNDEPSLVVRGWGYLTSGNNNLSYEEASKIQDDIGKWLTKKLLRK